MTKKQNVFSQILIKLFLNSGEIPGTPIDQDFVYLGRKFNFQMNNETAKAAVINKIEFLLSTTATLAIRPQSKLKILSTFVPSQLVFDLKLYNFPLT